MKPRNKLEREVWDLYNRKGYLKNNRMSPAFIEWVEKEYKMNEASCCKQEAWCSECGTSFHVEGRAESVVCPHCGATLKVVKSRRQHITNNANYIQELTTCGRWQIVKTYHIEADCHKGYRAGYYIHRCYEKWIDENGRQVVIARNIQMCASWKRIPWSFSPIFKAGLEWDQWREREVEFSIKDPDKDYYNGWNIQTTYPVARIQPWLKRYGLTRETHGIDFGDLATMMPNTPAETFWKSGEYALACFYMYADDYKIREFGPSIKVARRHGFDFKKMTNMADYIDYLRLLKQLDRDILNPVYIAPADFDAAHQEAIDSLARKRAREEARRAEEERIRNAERDRKAQAAYEKAKAAFLGLTFNAAGLNFHVLQSVSEFEEIGRTMHICVYSLRYFEKASSLILAATDEAGKRVEIIEVDLRGWKIIQSRAACNKASNRHAEIINIVTNNMGMIKRAARASA